MDAHLGGFFFFSMHYNKPHLSYNKQIDLLKSRGLLIPDDSIAIQFLKEISYYRLSAYGLPYQKTKDTFNIGTTFNDLISLYLFDRELRLLMFNTIERVEIAIRAQIIYQLSFKYGSHWQDNPAIFNPPFTHTNGKVLYVYSDTQSIIYEHCTAKHPEVFIKHYKNTYTNPASPPSWMAIELLTIGQLSRLYKALQNNIDKKEIADYFGLHQTVFISWLHSLTYARNICAHHSRLWNREFAIKPEILLKPKRPWTTINFTGNNQRCFYFLCTLKYMLGVGQNGNEFSLNLTQLIAKYPSVPIRFLGIPSTTGGKIIDWESEPLWKK